MTSAINDINARGLLADLPTLDEHFGGYTYFAYDAGKLYRWDKVGLTWELIADASLAGITLDTDGTLTANSDTRVASQKAVKTYVGSAVTGLLELKGSTDCSANPNYPAASKGDAYIVSVAGKIGGASGKSVDVGDFYIASADNAGGAEGSVGTSWVVIEHNLIGALLAANNLSDLADKPTARANLGLEAAAVDVASGSTTNIGAAASLAVRITGTTTITAFDNVAAGIRRLGYFAGALTLTHNATSLILPGGANITTAAGDSFEAISLGSGNWKVVFYQKADGTPIAGGGGGGIDMDDADPYGIHHRLSGSNSHDDEFSTDTSANYTAVTPTGTVNWAITNGVLSCKFSGIASADICCYLKAMTLADGEWWQTRKKLLTVEPTNYSMFGLVVTDGVLTSSNAACILAWQGAEGVYWYTTLYTGTITNLASEVASSRKKLDSAGFGDAVCMKLERVSSTSFKSYFGPAAGSQFSRFGITATMNPGFTPTHAGVLVSNYGGSPAESIVEYDYIRHMS